ncbi:MAG: NAD(P)H-hydrate epimerase [Acidobacteria bacterium]|nr:MAG: NAD(P)H-hydrate epimerase [Acidobacteriota bacterium]
MGDMYVLNADQMRAADAHAIDTLKIPSLQLMENAATQVTRVICETYPEPDRVVIVCGKGNNGGDGMAVARMLQERGWNTSLLLLASSSDLKNDPATNWKRAIETGVHCFENIGPADLQVHFSEAKLLVDALFGTVLSKSL